MIRIFITLLGFISMSAQAVTWGDFLKGHWNTDCKRSLKGTYVQNGYTFSDFVGPDFAFVTIELADYADPKCTKLLSFGQVLGHLSLHADRGDPQLELPSKGARIQWQLDPLLLAPMAFFDKKLVEDMNHKAYCGQSDWALGHAKDLLLTACSKDIRYYYSANWLSLEVVDPDHIVTVDKGGTVDALHRWAFKVPPNNALSEP